MDAAEFFKTAKRLCKNQDCDGCPVCKNNTCMVMLIARLYGASDESIEETVSKVEQWSKDHPVKTRQSEFLKMFPNVVMTRGVIALRPCRLDTQINECSGSDCDKCKRAYWLMEVTDND